MSSSSGKLDDNDQGMMEVTGKILIATIVALFVVIVLVFLFHIYARWLWLRRQRQIDLIHHRRQQDVHHNSAGVTVLRRGLDPSFLKTLPISQFHPQDFKDGCLECSVCLSEVQQGEDTRILPKCRHAFHAECIDMWFHSHSTCPICRTLVSDGQQTEVSVESLLHQNQQQEQQQQHRSTNDNNSNGGGDRSFPANVLFWGDETEVSTLTSQLEAANQHSVSLPTFEPTSTSSSSSSSSTSQTNDERLKNPDLVIDIPRASRNVGDNNISEDDQSTPMMRSLRRILSSSRRFYPFSPSNPNNNNTPQ